MGDTQAEDRWQGFPQQRQELLSFIEEEEIEGVLFIAGDFHFAQVCKVSPSGAIGEGLWEVLAGPGGSFLNVLGGLIPEQEQFPLSIAAWNFTEFVCDPNSGTIAITFIGDDATVLGSYTINL